MSYFKRMWVFVYILLVSATALLASTAYKVSYEETQVNQYELSYHLNDYSISDVVKNGKVYTQVDFDGGVLSHDKGYAALPFISKAIEIPNSKNMDLEIVNSDFVDIQLKNEYLPSRGILYRNQDISKIPYESVKANDNWYPANIADASTPFIFRDIRGERITFNPFQYNPAKKTLRVYKNITVKLQANSDTPINPILKSTAKVSPVMNAMYSTAFINYNKTRYDHSIGEMGSILVVYTSRDAAAITPYVEWKKQKGYTVYTSEVATGTDITTTVSDFYADHNDLLYVQIVGDWADIKTPYSGAAHDPNLGCVAGSDQYPELIIGRFSASSAAEVTVQVDKTIAYEKIEAGSLPWLKSSLGIASSQGSGQGDDGEGDWEHQNVIYDDKLDPFTYDTKKTAYETDGGNAATINQHLNSGVGIVNYTGHGSHDGWATPSYTISDLNSATNTAMLPFINSVACVVGEFYTGSDCFSEALQKKANGGAVVNMGSTINQSWAPPMRGQDYFNDLLIGGYDYTAHSGQSGINTTEQRTTFGALALNSNILMCNEDFTGGQPMLETWTTFGDASLQVRTDNPATLILSNSTVLQGIDFSTTITTSAGPVKGAMVALTQNGTTWSGVTDASGNVSIANSLLPGTCTFVVTAFNGGTIYNANKEVVPQSGPYLTVNSFSIVDGNNNQADFGETIKLTTVIKNVGADVSNSISLALSTESGAVASISDATGSISTLASGASATLTEEFELTLADNVEDQANVGLVMTMTDNSSKKVYTSNLNLVVNAPAFSIGAMTIDDSAGNNDGIIDPGETVNITIPVSNNGHALSPTATASLASPTSGITVGTSSVAIGTVAASASSNAVFTITAASSMAAGDLVELNFGVNAGNYTATHSENAFVSGTVIYPLTWSEDFNPMDTLWTKFNDGCVDKWSVSETNKAGGASPEAKLNWQSSAENGLTRLISPALNTQGTTGNTSVTVSFKHFYDWYSTGPEIKLQVSNDGETWTDTDWAKVPTENLTENVEVIVSTNIGPKTYFAWSLSGNMFNFDYWYIDDISVMGGNGIIYSSNTPDKTTLYQNYPNPFNPTTTINFYNKSFGKVDLSIYNSNGQLVKTLLNDNLKAGAHAVDFNAAKFNSGVYFYMLSTPNSKIVKKMLLVK